MEKARKPLDLVWALLLGVLMALAYPPFNLWWSLPVPLVLYLVLLQARVAAGRRSSLFSFLFWLAFFFGSLWWVLDFLHVFGGMPKILTPLPHLFLCSVLALFMTAGFWAARMFPAPWFWWVYPLGIAMGEWIKAHIIWGGFPWNTLCLPLTHVPALLQPASLTGSHGLSALMVLFLAGLLWMARRRRPNWAWIAIFSGLAAYTCLWMNHREHEGAIRIGVLQTDVDERARFFSGDEGEGMQESLEFSRQVLDQGAGLLLWPESVFAWEYSPDHETDLVRAHAFRQMEELSKRAPMFIVANRYEDGKAYNTAQLLRDGRILGIYRKMHLVPFGEYLPLRGLAERLGLVRVARSISDFSPGREPGIFHEPLPAGMSICFEAAYPQLAREQVRLGARLLVTLTNDAWYGSGGAAEQHFRLALMRSVELHRPLARSALTGISGFADAHGRVLDRLPLGCRGFLIRDLQPSGRHTIYGVTGDALPALFALASILAGLCRLALWVRSRAMRKDAKADPIY